MESTDLMQEPPRKFRGKNKLPTKGTRSENGTYRLGADQRKYKNARRRELRAKATVQQLRAKNSSLEDKLREVLEQSPLSSARVLTPSSSAFSFAMAQLEQSKFTMSHTVLEGVRLVEKPYKRYKRMTMPSKALIQQSRADIAVGGERITQPTLSEAGDIVTLNTETILQEILTVTNWPSVAVGPGGVLDAEEWSRIPALNIDGTADGGRLTATKGMVIHALKVVQPELVARLCATDETAGESSNSATATASASASATATATASARDGDDTSAAWKGVQSPKCVITCGFCHGSDSEAVDGTKNYDRLSRQFFGQLQALNDQPLLHPNGRAYKVNIGLPMDKKAAWDLTQLGSGSSSSGNFCTFCEISGVTKHFPSWLRCCQCQAADPMEQQPCFHRQIIGPRERADAQALADDDLALAMMLEFPSSRATVPELREFAERRLHLSTTRGGKPIPKATGPEVRSEIERWKEVFSVDPYSIDTVDIRVIQEQLRIRLPSAAVRDQFIGRVLPPTVVRPVPPRVLLRYVLFSGERLHAARRLNGRTPVIDCVDACIPCILHTEMRIGEKIITLMISHGILRRSGDAAQKEATRIALQNAISAILSSLPPGAYTEESYYRSSATLPGLHDGHLVFQLSGVRLQKLFLRRADMLDALFGSGNLASNPDERLRWKSLLDAYVGIFDRLRDFQDMDATTITELQFQIDSFCGTYRSMFGHENITNYLHDLQAGHFAEFLRRYGSLYRHANIGLEATVGTVSSYIHRGTQHGGHAGRAGGRFSEVQAMSRYLTSRAVYAIGKLSGDVDGYMSDMEAEGHYALHGALTDSA